MEIKMLCSVVLQDYTNYTHGGVYKVSKQLAEKLIKAGFAVEVKKPTEKKKTTTRKKTTKQNIEE